MSFLAGSDMPCPKVSFACTMAMNLTTRQWFRHSEVDKMTNFALGLRISIELNGHDFQVPFLNTGQMRNIDFLRK